MLQSRCILDTDRESQSGTTPRLIWALAMGKKVITTNKNITRMSFYDKEKILIIDRRNPVLDMNFINSPVSGTCMSKDLQNVRIDNWCKSIISF